MVFGFAAQRRTLSVRCLPARALLAAHRHAGTRFLHFCTFDFLHIPRLQSASQFTCISDSYHTTFYLYLLHTYILLGQILPPTSYHISLLDYHFRTLIYHTPGFSLFCLAPPACCCTCICVLRFLAGCTCLRGCTPTYLRTGLPPHTGCALFCAGTALPRVLRVCASPHPAASSLLACWDGPLRIRCCVLPPARRAACTGTPPYSTSHTLQPLY